MRHGIESIGGVYFYLDSLLTCSLVRASLIVPFRRFHRFVSTQAFARVISTTTIIHPPPIDFFYCAPSTSCSSVVEITNNLQPRRASLIDYDGTLLTSPHQSLTCQGMTQKPKGAVRTARPRARSDPGEDLICWDRLVHMILPIHIVARASYSGNKLDDCYHHTWSSERSCA